MISCVLTGGLVVAWALGTGGCYERVVDSKGIRGSRSDNYTPNASKEGPITDTGNLILGPGGDKKK